MANRDVIALVINWREVPFKNFEIIPSSIGVAKRAEVYDMWAHSSLGVFEPQSLLVLPELLGHGSFTLRFRQLTQR
jgi:hypothetical protein